MPGKGFYMSCQGAAAIKKSYDNISLLLVGEYKGVCDPLVMLSLLEDIKKDLIGHYQGYYENQPPLNPAMAQLSINLPQSLLNRLTNRASNENCSVHTLCVSYLSQGLWGVKQHL